MRPMKLLAAWAIAMVLSGAPLDLSCPVRSVHPFYTEGETIFVPELLGIWGREGEDEAWIVDKSDSAAYRLSMQGGEKEVTELGLEAHLLRLGKSRFLDIHSGGSDGSNSVYPIFMFPAHTIYKIDLNGDVLTLTPLRVDWVEDRIDERKLDIPHVRASRTILLTAPTAELQALLLKYEGREDAFEHGATYHRRK